MKTITDSEVSRFEERVRDQILGPLVLKLIPEWIKPNHVTFLRVFLVLVAIGLYIIDCPLRLQVWVLVVAALTDAVDGILARVRQQISRMGAYLDHASDWFLGIWAGVLALTLGLLPMAFIVLIVIPQLGIIVADRIRAARIQEEHKVRRVLTITMGAANFRPSLFARLQFFTILIGFFLLLFSYVKEAALIERAGLISLYVAVGLAWYLLISGWVKLGRENRHGENRIQ